ncbi:hypothetical protein D6856_14885 [Butyrivibrio sp. XB500-5]|uniref:hypothetical protein n=1 Tax=Butyrivibrio sp. XB500-5 TaxID=2364880 RepID=UPI000EA8ACDF|nr:hypothetical protein [Butyrivibrio sp. XB500-5]RKM56083.1 hypothetical protein D6856_14885 [Butyrivibrio sp. XB500-5]
MATIKKATTSKKSTSGTNKATTSKAKSASTNKPKKTGTSASAKKSTGSSVKVTAAEKKLLELYRAADADTKKAALAILKGEKTQLGGILESILENKTIMNTVTSLFK